MATRAKTGGRQVGSKNRITDSMRRDILSVYRKLGGQKFLLSWAQQNGTEYVKQCLARVMPAMPRQALDEQEEAEFGMPALSNFEAARRIAFILARADAMPHPLDVEMVELSPASPAPEPPAPYRPALDELPERQDLPDPAPPTSAPEAEETIETFRGNATEQGRARFRSEVVKDPRAAARDALLARHRRELI